MEDHPLKTFIIYASKDRSLREELESHLRPLVDMGWLALWSDREILPGAHWDKAIEKQLAQADLFLMLVSVDFYNSGYIREKEFTTAVARLESGAALVIPIIVRPCTWKFYPVIKDLQVLPPGGVAVADLDHWRDRDKAWNTVVEKIGERVVLFLEERKGGAAPSSAPKAQPIRQPKNGDTRRDLPYAPEMVFVEGSTFQMGSNNADNEKPMHPVTLSSFWLGKYPVTFEEYDRFCVTTGREKPGDEGWGWSRCPVINVSWEDALAYGQWLSQQMGKTYRLPTEAEWEFAARGGMLSQGFHYAGSNNLGEVAWYRKNSGKKSQPVGKKKSNELGLHDMSGNVWEWCGDRYWDYAAEAQMNPKGPNSEGAYRVLRGGSWGDSNDSCRTTVRVSIDPRDRHNFIGFRVVQDV